RRGVRRRRGVPGGPQGGGRRDPARGGAAGGGRPAPRAGRGDLRGDGPGHERAAALPLAGVRLPAGAVAVGDRRGGRADQRVTTLTASPTATRPASSTRALTPRRRRSRC